AVPQRPHLLHAVRGHREAHLVPLLRQRLRRQRRQRHAHGQALRLAVTFWPHFSSRPLVRSRPCRWHGERFASRLLMPLAQPRHAIVTPPVEKPRILCVDDEPALLEGITPHLRRRFDVTTAPSGPAGLELVNTRGPFAVV